eukprot:gene15691-biopygen259
MCPNVNFKHPECGPECERMARGGARGWVHLTTGRRTTDDGRRLSDGTTGRRSDGTTERRLSDGERRLSDGATGRRGDGWLCPALQHSQFIVQIGANGASS